MDEDPKALRLLKEENKKNSALIPALVVAVLAAAAFPILLVIAATAPPTEEFHRSAMALAAAAATLAAAYVALRNWRRETPGETARRLDNAARAKNSLEASLELRSLEGHPLKDAQLAQTSSLYAEFPIRRWSLIVAMAWLAAAIFILAEIAFVSIQFEFSDAQKKWLSEEKNLRERLKKIAEEKNRRRSDYFKLALISPEPEKRAKPLDEIEWKGVAESNRGFHGLRLAVSVNGVHKKDFEIKGFKPDAEGTLELSGTFRLDELGVEPFDLVSYNIEGRMDFNGEKNKLVMGIPQFIEVRPFKEDPKRIAMSCDKAKSPVYNILVKFLCVQISLNKAAYAIRSSGLPYDDRIMGEQIALLEKEQRKLEMEVDAFLKKNTRPLPPNILDNMKKAERGMRNAALRLKEAVEMAKKEVAGK